MKYILVDYTNSGVVFLSDSNNVNKLKWDFSILQSCILDTFCHGVSETPVLTKENIKRNFVFGSHGNYTVGKPHEINETFSFKQHKADLIYPIIFKLTEGLMRYSGKHINQFYLPIDDTLAYQLSKCQPNNNIYSVDIIRYAQVVGMSPEEAYKEINLEVETQHSIKMRIYATAKKYENLIREVSTKEQANLLIEELEQKLIRESQI